MGSALAFWAYQRNLGQTEQMHQQNEQRETEMKLQTRTKRTESESSTTSWPADPAIDRRGSAADSTDDEALEHPQHQAQKGKGQRKFSLDFLFARKPKNKNKEKSKRSQSVAVSNDGYLEDASQLRDYRPPGMTGSEYALAM